MSMLPNKDKVLKTCIDYNKFCAKFSCYLLYRQYLVFVKNVPKIVKYLIVIIIKAHYYYIIINIIFVVKVRILEYLQST